MDNKENNICSGKIERGVVRQESPEGYQVMSYDRDGLETPPLHPADNRTYKEGDKVYYFIFPDGTGKIICPL